MRVGAPPCGYECGYGPERRRCVEIMPVFNPIGLKPPKNRACSMFMQRSLVVSSRIACCNDSFPGCSESR